MTTSDNFQHDSGSGTANGSPPSSPDQVLLLTYRFLRLGILAAVTTLSVSLLAEIVRTQCVRNSISAYFYSPSRTIFTGSLMAVGLCLIAIQGDDDWDEVSLNVAGMLAPMIAVLPTSVSTTCDPAFEGLTDTDPNYRAMIEAIEAQTRDGLHNNVIAYFGVLLAALIAVAVLVPRRLVRSDLGANKVRTALLVYIALVGVFVYFASRTWNTHSAWAHNLSAVLMFVFFGVVVCYNATRRQAPRWYRISCLAIAVLMAAVALGVFPVLRWMLDVRWSVFFLEATQTALFAAFWFLQTIAFVDRNPVTAKKIAGPAGA